MISNDEKGRMDVIDRLQIAMVQIRSSQLFICTGMRRDLTGKEKGIPQFSGMLWISEENKPGTFWKGKRKMRLGDIAM